MLLVLTSKELNKSLYRFLEGSMVGPAGFEPASIAPEATSLDQASRRPLAKWLGFCGFKE